MQVSEVTLTPEAMLVLFGVLTEGRYTIETHQAADDSWMGIGRVDATTKQDAIAQMNEQHARYHCPKRVVNMSTGEVIAEIGNTPEYRAHAANVRAILAANDRQPVADETKPRTKSAKQIRRETLNWAVRETRTMNIRCGGGVAKWAAHFARASGCVKSGISVNDVIEAYDAKFRPSRTDA